MTATEQFGAGDMSATLQPLADRLSAAGITALHVNVGHIILFNYYIDCSMVTRYSWPVYLRYGHHTVRSLTLPTL